MKSEENKVSVIIPVYNAENTLDRCMDSLWKQTADSFQIVVVDDGSQDTSYAKLHQYKELWGERMILLQKENGGAASARNLALEHVDTPYVMFCDSDDYVEPDYVEIMLNIAETEDADIVSCSYYIENGSKTRKCVFDIKAEYLSDNKDLICDTDVVLWNKIYRLSLFKDDDVKMPEGIIFEDNGVMPKLVSRSKKLVSTDALLYHYDVSVVTSVMNNYRARIEDMLQVVHELHKDQNEKVYWEQYQYIYTESVFCYISNVVFDADSEQKIERALDILNEYNVKIQNECFARHMRVMNKNKKIVYLLILNHHMDALRCFLRIRELKNRLIRKSNG